MLYEVITYRISFSGQGLADPVFQGMEGGFLAHHDLNRNSKYSMLDAVNNSYNFV